MRRYPELRPNFRDGLVAAAVVVLMVAAGFLFWRTDAGDHGLTAVISVDGVEQEQVVLSSLPEEETRMISANGYELELQLMPDGAEICASDCPTQDCVHTGKITRAGQSIVCLPARVVVELKGTAAPDGVDTVIG